jgi:chromate reductase
MFVNQEDNMAEQLNILSFCGSLRKGSYNAALMRTLPALAPAGMSFKTATSFAGLPVYNFDDQQVGIPALVNTIAAEIRAADGLTITSPEYNWTIPGGFKNLIDWLSRLKETPLEGKAVALQSCAGGLLGGSRMQYHMRQSLASIGAQVFIKPEVFVTMSAKKFDEKTLELTDQPTRDMVKAHLQGFEKFARRWNGK